MKRNYYASVTLPVTPRFASHTRGYASYAFINTGSYIEKSVTKGAQPPRSPYTHIGTLMTGYGVTRVTNRHPRKNKRLKQPPGYALNRNHNPRSPS